jgi:hypothetical protein
MPTSAITCRIPSVMRSGPWLSRSQQQCTPSQRATLNPMTVSRLCCAEPIGLMALLAAILRGAKQIVAVEVAERRKETAIRLGATGVIGVRICFQMRLNQPYVRHHKFRSRFGHSAQLLHAKTFRK